MARLNQILAVEKGLRDDHEKIVVALHNQVIKPELISGFTRVYEKLNDEDPDLATEQQRVQIKTADVIAEVTQHLTKLFDVTAIKDWTNTKAFADVKVGDQVLIEKAPSTYLLWLLNQLKDIEKFVRKLPVLDPSLEWTFDAVSNVYKSNPVKSHRTQKESKAFVLYEATPEHPAQVDRIDSDVIKGYWTKIEFSGALPLSVVQAILDRVVTLKEAVKFAKEEANSIIAEDVRPGKAIFDYLFGSVDTRTP